MKLFSTNYYTSESLPEVEQISLFSNMASGGGFANYGAVAYRIVNAQHWGIPQRRRRVYAVCDTSLSEKALNGILNRASRRGKKLQDLLLTAIHGMIEWWHQNPAGGGNVERTQ